MNYIKHYLFTPIFFLTVLSASAQNSQFKLESIKAYMFYNANNDSPNSQVIGTISENIIDKSDFWLWNTVIGEGAAEGASNQTLIVVDVKGIGNEYKTGIIRLTCKTSEKILLTQENEFSIFSADNKHSEAFLVNETGCEHLEITAEVFDTNSKKIQDKLVKNIYYECGE